MSQSRTIEVVLASRPTIEGAGVRLKRVFGFHQKPDLDPFLLLDHFGSTNPDDYLKGFPWHPHRGIETITYMLHGQVEHGDSLGNQGVINSGDVQWMTAGSGIIHQEMPQSSPDGAMWGFQLWANLPASHKMMAPRYRDVTREEIPEVQLDSGILVKVISGEINGVPGPVRDIVIDPQLLDVALPPGSEFNHSIPDGYTVFAYVYEGQGVFDERGALVSASHLAVYDRSGAVAVRAADQGLRFLLVAGKPIGEPVAWYGPIVMNTEEELRIAFEEYRNGTFLKHKQL